MIGLVWSLVQSALATTHIDWSPRWRSLTAASGPGLPVVQRAAAAARRPDARGGRAPPRRHRRGLGRVLRHAQGRGRGGARQLGAGGRPHAGQPSPSISSTHRTALCVVSGILYRKCTGAREGWRCCPRGGAQGRKTPRWPRSWANFSLLQLYSHRDAWANSHILGQPNTFLAAQAEGVRYLSRLTRVGLEAFVECADECVFLFCSETRLASACCLCLASVFDSICLCLPSSSARTSALASALSHRPSRNHPYHACTSAFASACGLALPHIQRPS